jgi:hypothetical protein
LHYHNVFCADDQQLVSGSNQPGAEAKTTTYSAAHEQLNGFQQPAVKHPALQTLNSLAAQN